MGAEEDRRREFVEGLEFCGKMEDEERSGDESSLLAMEEEEEEEQEEESSSSSDALRSSSSTDSSDMVEDASSSCSTSSMLKYSSSNSSSSASLLSCRGPLYELSELMSHLPMKRGLSKYYDGRSQSYTSLASVKSLEDLQKKEIVINGGSSRKRLKLCRSYAGGLDKSVMSPRAVISKKGSNRGLSSSSSQGRRSTLAIASRSPVPVLRT